MVTQNAINSKFINNADGFSLGGGTTSRSLVLTGADVTVTGSGTNTYTFPSTTDTLMGLASAQTVTGAKTYSQDVRINLGGTASTFGGIEWNTIQTVDTLALYT